MTEGTRETRREPIRLELRYCRRCGVLGVAPEGSSEPVCPACRQTLRWLGGGPKGETDASPHQY
jgi:hypothetical protein